MIALILILHIVFVLAGTNSGNGRGTVSALD